MKLEIQRWPSPYSPLSHPIQVSNSIQIAAGPEQVWGWLIEAAKWPLWYPNSQSVCFLSGCPPLLRLHTQFRWRTFGVAVQSQVLDFEPNRFIAWGAQGLGFSACHAWELQQTPSGCRVVTEEIQCGIGAKLQQALMPTRMWNGHQLWLQRLKEVSEG